MAMNNVYAAVEPSRSEIDKTEGPMLVEFGSPWCGYCRAAQPLLTAALAERPAISHVKVADGPGLPLGRSFGVKLWPTLIFLKQGREVARLVRPRDSAAIGQALAQIDVS